MGEIESEATLQPSGSRIRKNSEIAKFDTVTSEFLRIRLQITFSRSELSVSRSALAPRGMW